MLNLRDEIATWGSAALDLLYPPRCPDCRQHVEENGAWCRVCLGKFWNPRWLDLRERRLLYLDSCLVMTDYLGALQPLFRGLKFQGKRQNAGALAWLAMRPGEGLREPGLNRRIDLAVPVPLAEGRLRERGFNQTALLFAKNCRRAGIPWREDLLQRNRSTHAQWDLDRAKRHDNIKGAFTVTRPAELIGKRILLVDDIVTTGITMEECARVLKAAGATSVRALAIAGGGN